MELSLTTFLLLGELSKTFPDSLILISIFFKLIVVVSNLEISPEMLEVGVAESLIISDLLISFASFLLAGSSVLFSVLSILVIAFLLSGLLILLPTDDFPPIVLSFNERC